MKRRNPFGSQPGRPGAPGPIQPPTPAQAAAVKLNAALALHQQGELDRAEAIYQEILHAQPRHFDALQLLATIAAQRRNSAAAVTLFDRALEITPHHVGALVNRGVALQDLKRAGEALASYERALRIAPDHVIALNNRASVLVDLKRPEEALQCCDRALRLQPDYADALNNRGNALRALARSGEALESYDRALRVKPDHAEALNNRGLALQDLDRPAEALESHDRALQIRPDLAQAFHNRGNALLALKRREEALESYERAIGIDPCYAEALNNRGVALHDLKRLAEALESYDRALAIIPGYADPFHNRGLALFDLKRPDEALGSYDRALAIRPDFAQAFYNRGNAFLVLKRREEALENYDRALQLEPDYLEALHNRGVVLRDLRRLEESVATYERALKLAPDNAEAFSHRGIALHELKRLDAALESFERALAIRPDYADALNNRGNTLVELQRLAEASQSYARVLLIDPDYDFLYGVWLFTRMRIGDWNDIESAVRTLMDKVSRGERASQPFPVLVVSEDPELQRRAAETWVQDEHPPQHTLPALPVRSGGDRIRIGYFSGDYHTHPVAQLTAGLFESHDRSRFEITAFSYGPDTGDPMRKRLNAAFDRFMDVRTRSDRETAMLARSLELDIAVDLGGFTDSSRPGVFAMRAAPLQVNFLGYPGTMGADYIDYLIADATIVPEALRRHYSEKIAYLPSYQPNDSKRAVAEREFTREELGLPQTGFVFCCFNNHYKITPGVFDGWMRLLEQVEGSVLWLSEGNEQAKHNLRKEAAQRGVAAERLVFAARMPSPAEHLARHRLADLFIDTFPYNAHTTASDALWAGLPVLTRIGETFASRVGASLLNAIDLPELITSTQEQYESLAVALATRPERLGQIRRKLADNRRTALLFDTTLYTRHIEAAYAEMYRRHRSGLAPEHICVGPDESGREKSVRHEATPGSHVHAAATGLERPEALNDRGIALHGLNRLTEALESFDRALRINPDYADALSNRGATLNDLNRHDEALESFDRALRIAPAHANALYNRGDALRALGRSDEALECYDRALGTRPDHADACNNRGLALKDLKRPVEALASYDRALRIRPDYVQAWSNRGNALLSLQRLDEALASYEKALALEPDSVETRSNLLFALNYTDRLSRAALFEQHSAWSRRHEIPLAAQQRGHANSRDPRRRLRVGYVSPDFRRHSVAYFIEPVLAQHDRSAFELYCYSNVVNPDRVTERLLAIADGARSIVALSDAQAAELVRADGIDILVDLAGHTARGRLGVFALKPAPVQASYLGYPNTSGLAAIDWRVTDAHADPPGEGDAFYSEHLARLPRTFLCFRPPEEAPPVEVPPFLEKGYITFGSFNARPKVTAQVIGVWARLLERVPGSRLMLKGVGLGDPLAQAHLLEAFAQHGIGENRLTLLPHDGDFKGHLARYHEMDIGLDPFPYNGTTTTCEALWMGVPVVSLAGERHAARVGVSILANLGLDELIARSCEDYLDRAAALATNAARLVALREALRARVAASPLRDEAGFARSLESAYREMWRRWCLNEPPAPLDVAPRGA